MNATAMSDLQCSNYLSKYINIMLSSVFHCSRYSPSPNDPSLSCVPGPVLNRSPVWKEKELSVGCGFVLRTIHHDNWTCVKAKTKTKRKTEMDLPKCEYVSQGEPGIFSM